ncbi:hypothetical protein C2G38_2203373 [Gigaspora rosea]|uniref:Uncharacterized protein n=1 Tax=Gigaspora rosea TaxID=44941 RepID=A0A397UMI4_9GLOM|nr:hypothetical protein C2G38_2203373 [Gigaspora rosea]
MTNITATLIKNGLLDENHYYGAYSRYWWRLSSINKKKNYYCESGSFSSIKPDLTSAISTVYKRIFNNQTCYSGFSVLEWTNESIIQQLLLNVQFISISFSLGEYKIFIFGIGPSSNFEWNYAGSGYKSSLLRTTNGKRVLYVSKIENNFCALEIYKDFNLKDRVEGSSPNEVWQRLKIYKYTGMQLYGLENLEVQSFIRQYHIPSCLPNNWSDYALMKFFFDHHLKRRTLADINWHTLFLNWHKNQNNIIELYSSLESLYSLDYQFSDRKIGAWRAMLRACGCHNITP